MAPQSKSAAGRSDRAAQGLIVQRAASGRVEEAFEHPLAWQPD